jgi:hypothetical protein
MAEMSNNQIRSVSRHKQTKHRVLLGSVLTLAVFLLTIASASADYEQVPEHFEPDATTVNEPPSGRAAGIAVNVTGAGLPPREAGSIYVAQAKKVLRYSAGEEGEAPQLRESWTGNFFNAAGVAIDQATGNVYVLAAESYRVGPEAKAVEVFTATGSPIGAFGHNAIGHEVGEHIKSIDETPGEFHGEHVQENAIAVDEFGDVYVTDSDLNSGGVADYHSRVMVWEPESPGNYEHYAYAGQGRDFVTSSDEDWFERLALVGNDRIVTATRQIIREFATTGGPPICTYLVPGGGVQGMTANPETGEVFYSPVNDGKLHRLGPCDEATGKFEELQAAVAPSEAGEIRNLAVNPTLAWSSLRPTGVVYDTRLARGRAVSIGDIFAPVKGTPPSIVSESTAGTTATSANLEAALNPHGFGTDYHFQYLSEGAYEANEPNERQSLTVGATGGLLGLRFQGRGLGGPATADLTAGSKVAQNLTTASGTATVQAATGTAKLTALTGTAAATAGSTTLTAVSTATGAGVLSAGEGKGTVTAGSKVIEGLVTEKGGFAVGQNISGAGIPSNATVASIGSGTLELSAKATVSGSAIPLKAASNKVTSVHATSGEFLVGQTIAGTDIPSGTKISAVGAESLTLSNLPTGAGPEALSAGTQPLKAGEAITGEGIPPGTTITAAGPRTLTLSSAVKNSAAQISFTASSATLTNVTTTEGTFEVGEAITGEGIPPGTTVKSVGANKLVLSQAVQKAGAAVPISAGVPVLTEVAVGEGSFEPGTPITGEGIPSGTRITGVGDETLTISQAPTKPGTGVAITSSGPAPLAIGETVAGPGIPTGTTVAAIEAGKLTLSAAAGSTVSGAHLYVGLPFDAEAAEVQHALEGLPTIAGANVKVSGGPGDASGSHPYELEFTGSLGNQNVPALEADASGLSGGSASAVVATEHNGGGGFDHGAIDVPVGGGELPGTEVGTASAGVSGLAPESRYVFRVVASSECRGTGQPACEVNGEPASFTTYPEPTRGLPEGRAYELVSPARKEGGEVFPADPQLSSCYECKPPGYGAASGFPMLSASDGDEVAYAGLPFSLDEGTAFRNSYISNRLASGWQTSEMSPAIQGAGGGEDLSYNDRLSEGLKLEGAAAQLAPEAPVGYVNMYLQQVASPTDFQPLLTKAQYGAHSPHRAPGSLVLTYAGSSADYSAHFFTANDALTGETSYAPEPPDPGSSGQDLYEWRDGRLSLVNVLPGNDTVAVGASIASASPDTHAISANGRRVFWKAGGQLYMREDGRTTREIHHSGSFLAASPNGLEVLLSDGCLYSLTSASCTDLTAGQGGFLGIAGASDDLSKIYFVDSAALASGAEPGTCKFPKETDVQGLKEERTEGKVPPGLGCNLYAYEAGGSTRFIATLRAQDSGSTSSGYLDDWAAAPGDRTAQASPDGRYLAFGSGTRLTGFDNTGLCSPPSASVSKEFRSGLCNEIFLYDSVTGKLTCPSCNTPGEAPRGGSNLRRILGARGWFPQPRYLTDEGRLYFDSSDRLSPLDTNGRVEDVYEAEPQGVGSCERPSGCLSLVSPGSGAADSNLLAIDASGANVFFTTRDRVVQADTDDLVDLYDAREGGGFPGETETQRAECQGESCQPVAQAPDDATPASATFQGAGNVKETAHGHKKHAHKKHKRKKAKAKRAAGQNRGGVK